MMLRLSSILLAALLLGCSTTGQLTYITPEGETRQGCETEYVGAPQVDRHAVRYILSQCARQAQVMGHTIVDQALLSLDLSLPVHPEGKSWTFEYATLRHEQGLLTDKEYGYIIAAVDMGMVK